MNVPLYTWQVEDHRRGLVQSGVASTAAGAKSDAEMVVARFGRRLQAIGASVTNPGGEGGFHARDRGEGRALGWVKWERSA